MTTDLIEKPTSKPKAAMAKSEQKIWVIMVQIVSHWMIYADGPKGGEGRQEFTLSEADHIADELRSAIDGHGNRIYKSVLVKAL